MSDGSTSPGRQPVPYVSLLAALFSAITLIAALSLMLISAYRREGRLQERIAEATQEAQAARSEAHNSQRRLADQENISDSLETKARRQDAAITDLRVQQKQNREQHLKTEKDVGSLLRTSEDKSDELIRRHNRILELQRDVARLLGDRDTQADEAKRRESRLKREYEAEISGERARRKLLEEKLEALDEIEELRGRLKELVEAMEKAVETQ